MNFIVGFLLGYLLSDKVKLPSGGVPGGLPQVPPGTLPANWPQVPTGTEIPWVVQPKPGGQPQPQPQAAQTYTIKSGDYPSGLAQKRTGDGNRWRELLTVNPEMSTYTDNKGQTQIKPWNVNQTIVLPPGW